MNVGRLSSAALMLSGVAAIANPKGVVAALHLTADDARGVAETRAGLGGTYAALGGWALLSREPAADVAVGMTWLGAAGVRVATRSVDRPSVTAGYWVYLGLEVACGAVSLASAIARRRGIKHAAGQGSVS
ncbi:MAG TPA: hypothetical protein VGS19_36345 [Streptosporangiaceae bacterium]|nr:hypothetical protein [Streptosporangiaceae bacterium]